MEIVVKDVVKYYGQYPALRGVTLEVPRGVFQCLIGPSGSGKSTLLHIVGGVDKPTEGEVVVAGTRLNDLNDDQLAEFRNKNIGFVFQLFYLIPRMSILENVELPLILRGVPKEKRREMALEALRLVGMGHVDPKKKPTQLSGGEQQRVAIARAIVTRPRILLADEPTGNLDSATAKVVMDTFLTLKKELGITIVMVTHNLELLTYCDRYAKMRDGKIIETG
ncbi:ABC transporter ATP-binding protein [Pyrobaculum aerophilum]|uniref:ABC transporter ATP-binding protein, putative n=2 Tax=Pyrobaculum aerophilum TaxID=13773 RepID=Q8ZUH3_PYRAE|nr:MULTISPECIES: ABC transporter ATP-binding protein [Pyrobaculum]AAL64434.1 ABC transporter ATP-binding protein, putative [Pyrobaculum aerophilum str. IM2]MCX8135598.1 ABC transporter ATP-binding protein [Pyrobaculum aerophilum]HII47292.1 ABC transporter ATP-binding protein [Pyrobaculum aerophilum]